MPRGGVHQAGLSGSLSTATARVPVHCCISISAPPLRCGRQVDLDEDAAAPTAAEPSPPAADGVAEEQAPRDTAQEPEPAPEPVAVKETEGGTASDACHAEATAAAPEAEGTEATEAQEDGPGDGGDGEEEEEEESEVCPAPACAGPDRQTGAPPVRGQPSLTPQNKT